MQIIHKNENERRCNRRTDTVDFVIYIRKISGCVERKYIGRFGSKIIGI